MRRWILPFIGAGIELTANARHDLDRYGGFVPIDGSLVVEGTNSNGRPAYPRHDPGPLEAVRSFLRDRADFAPDDRWRRMRCSFQQHGWLQRVAHQTV